MSAPQKLLRNFRGPRIGSLTARFRRRRMSPVAMRAAT